METYEAMRHFADSWGLLAMVLFFLAVVLKVLLPGSKEAADEAASIPLNEISPKDAEARAAKAGKVTEAN